MEQQRAGTLVIACGALAREIAALKRANRWDLIEVRCLPAELHNRPERIAPAVQEEIRAQRGRYARVFVAYADCGTGGALDAVIARFPGVERLPGAHCYEVFAGSAAFAALHDAELGTFYLTDFLTRHFDALVWRGLGLDRHPELRDTYFGAYRRVVLLAQAPDPELIASARAASARLGLAFEHRATGRDGLRVPVHTFLDPRQAQHAAARE